MGTYNFCPADDYPSNVIQRNSLLSKTEGPVPDAVLHMSRIDSILDDSCELQRLNQSRCTAIIPSGADPNYIDRSELIQTP